MSIFVKATPAPTPKTTNIRSIALLYGLILMVFALTQLVTFQDFILIIDSYWLPLDRQLTALYAALIVTLELLAVPFLLRFKLSPAMRLLSMVAGWIIAAFWICMSVWLVLTDNAVSSIGFLGGLITIMPGLGTVLVATAMGILAAWASWGMWPFAGHSTKTKK